MRIYLPATLAILRALLEDGSTGEAPVTAFAVTPALREWYATGDTEELEYIALTGAARASLRLLDLDPAAPRRRAVVVAEVADAEVTVRSDLERAAVQVGAPVRL